VSNRSDTEQIITDLFTAYRGSPLTSAEVVEMAMAALDDRDVFVKRSIERKTTEAPAPDRIDDLVDGLSRCYVSTCEDDYEYVIITCQVCGNEVQVDDDGTWLETPTIKQCIEYVNRHWRSHH
jgi:hypothetical protein